MVVLVAGGLTAWLLTDTSAPTQSLASGSFRDTGSGVSASDDAPQSMKAVPDDKVAKPFFTGTESPQRHINITKADPSK
ncbi:hypothetical protein ACFVYA_26755 [Amycolatopsis sp. NPDC058278]|uniref:hypothetical protein n=1 Tax=Amycolatopsis sp. NPDC058278 TaxID=3346417 RepID=UPI0036DC5AD3